MKTTAGRRNTDKQRRFANIEGPRVPRTRIDRSHGIKTTFNGGELIPIFLDDVLPGDTMVMRPRLFGRMTTPKLAILDNLYLDTFWFFVPNRLLWDNWREFMGQKDDPTDTTEYTIPTIADSAILQGSLGDYLGLPINVIFEDKPSVLPFRAYSLIWGEWFRAEHVQAWTRPPTGDTGETTSTTHPIKKRNKRHDYITSCLPWPQAGGEVQLPFGTGTLSIDADQPYPTFMNYDADAGPQATGRRLQAGMTDTGTPDRSVSAASGTGQLNDGDFFQWETTGLEASWDTSSLNELRTAIALQQFLERDSRGGQRYTEIIKNHFGVTYSDGAQRPEFLGGSSTRINVNPVHSTTVGTSQELGDTAAYITMSDAPRGFSKSFVEHGYVLGLVNVRAELTWQQNVERHWRRQTRYDYFWPGLAHLGEQAVRNDEVKAVGTGTPGHDAGTFGYQERYAEYKYKPSTVTSTMRSEGGAIPSLDIYHLAIDLASDPVLNTSFLEDAPPLDRVLQVTEATAKSIQLDAWFDYRCVRPMPLYSTPGLSRF